MCQRGFTAIELVTTVVIMGILAAVAVPRFFDNDAFSERGYADELASALRYSQRIAIASGCQVRIVINAANYSAMQRNGCANATAWGMPVKRADGTNLTGRPPLGVALAPAATTIIFYTTGRVSNGGALTIGTTFVVNIDPVNGSVTVQP